MDHGQQKKKPKNDFGAFRFRFFFSVLLAGFLEGLAVVEFGAIVTAAASAAAAAARADVVDVRAAAVLEALVERLVLGGRRSRALRARVRGEDEIGRRADRDGGAAAGERQA